MKNAFIISRIDNTVEIPIEQVFVDFFADIKYDENGEVESYEDGFEMWDNEILSAKLFREDNYQNAVDFLEAIKKDEKHTYKISLWRLDKKEMPLYSIKEFKEV